MLRGILICLGTALVLTGCAAGQQVNMDYKPATKNLASNGASVKTSVSDQRPEVKTGGKDPSFIGSYRGSFSLPFDVSNYQNKPLAEQIAQDLQQELKSLGFQNATGDQPQKLLEVKILSWSFDGMVNGDFSYELLVSVLDKSGSKIYEKTLKGREEIEGSMFSGIKPGVEKNMPDFYNKVIRSIARNNKDALVALN
ncbi:MAG: hypothetical protein JWL63_1266 [Rhodocyclales bacterium]|nr:hypothetical protein [Rhodocyclales bacterium]